MTKLTRNILLFLIFCLSFGLRLYKIDNPIADWHSWRQADTASVTRNFIKQGFTPFYPKFDSLKTLNWRYTDKNPDRYFFAEFPIYNILTYPIYKQFGINTIYHRLVSVFFSSLTIFSLYFLVKLYSSSTVAYLSSLIFALLPYNVYYGRVIMADPLHVFFSITALLFFSLWLRQKKFFICLLASIFFALTILTKPYSLVLLLPISILILQKFIQKKPIKYIQLIIFLLLSLTPYLLWKVHIDRYPQGQFDTAWLFNSTNIRFRPAFFRWIIFERFNNLILGSGGFVLLFFGLIAPKSKKESLFYYSWLVSLLIFVTIIATGNVTHDYYQLPFVPIFSIFCALGIEHLYKIAKKPWQKAFNIGIALFLFAYMLFIGAYYSLEFFKINNWTIVEAGLKADQILPQDALVIAPYNKDPAFLYQSNRWGWTDKLDNLEESIEIYDKPIYLVSTTRDDYTNTIVQNYQVVYQQDNFIIVKIK